jgi:hypothetical protein
MSPAAGQGGGEQVVSDSHEVRGSAHERRPNDLPPFWQASEVVALEVAEPDSEADVEGI